MEPNLAKKYDVIIVGLGIAGSSIAYRLAKEGKSVLAIDQYDPPHSYGSSHGETRVTRIAPFEGDIYYQLAIQSFPLWKELEQQTGQKYYFDVGGLDIGHVDDSHYQTAFQIAQKYDVPHQLLDASDLHAKYKAFHLPEDTAGILFPQSGYLLAEESWQVFLSLAEQHGAELHRNEQVIAVEENDLEATVTTGQGVYQAEKVFLAMGGWIKNLYTDQKNKIKILRQVLAWCEVEDIDAFLPDRFPIFAMTLKGKCLYGFPTIDNKLVKIACHGHLFEEISSDDELQVTDQDKNYILDQFQQYFHGIKGIKRAQTCKYTSLEDDLFLVDYVPHSKRQIIFSCCSGHGFKYAPIYGEMALDFLNEDNTRFDWDIFSYSRFD